MASGDADTGPDPPLPRELLLRVLRFLPRNTRAFSGRLTCKDAAQHFSKPKHCTVRLCKPLPALPCAIEWARDKAQQGIASLSFRRQLRLFVVAAHSGCATNLEVVLSVMQPRMCPELLSTAQTTWPAVQLAGVGEAAARAGHAHLLPWLLAHCPGLVHPAKTLHEVAQHCDLGRWQRAWGQLRERVVEASGASGDGSKNPFWQQLLASAAECALHEGCAKLEWVLATADGRCRVTPGSLPAAIRSGDLSRVRWLVGQLQQQGEQLGQEEEQQQGQQEAQQHEQQQGQQAGQQQQLWGRKGPCVLAAALQHADLGLVEWLVGQAGCPLPDPADVEACGQLAGAAAASGSIARLQWLAEGGLPVDEETVLGSAARAGRVEVLRHVWAKAGGAVPSGTKIVEQAARSGSVDTTVWLLQQGCTQTGIAFAIAVLNGNRAQARLLAAYHDPPDPDVDASALVLVWPSVTRACAEELCAVVPSLWDEAFGDQWLQYAFRCAVRRGHLPLIHVLLGLRPGFVPSIDGTILEHAANGGSEGVLRWLAGQRTGAAAAAPPGAGGDEAGAAGVGGVLAPWPWMCCCKALANGDLATAAFLCSHGGVEWPPGALALAAARGFALSALQWLVAHGTPAGPGEVRAALAAAGSSGVQEWLCSLQQQEGGAAAAEEGREQDREQPEREEEQQEQVATNRRSKRCLFCAVQ